MTTRTTAALALLLALSAFGGTKAKAEDESPGRTPEQSPSRSHEAMQSAPVRSESADAARRRDSPPQDADVPAPGSGPEPSARMPYGSGFEARQRQGAMPSGGRGGMSRGTRWRR
jgi:hypothetical protein